MTITVEYGACVAPLPNGEKGVVMLRAVRADNTRASCVEILMDVDDALAMVRFSREPWARFEIEDWSCPGRRMYFSTTSPSSEQGEMAWIPGKGLDPIYDSPDSDWFPLLMDEVERAAREAS